MSTIGGNGFVPGNRKWTAIKATMSMIDRDGFVSKQISEYLLKVTDIMK